MNAEEKKDALDWLEQVVSARLDVHELAKAGDTEMYTDNADIFLTEEGYELCRQLIDEAISEHEDFTHHALEYKGVRFVYTEDKDNV